MAVLWLDGCDTYTAAADITARYGGSSSVGLGPASGRFGGGAVCLNSSLTTTVNSAGPVIIPHSGASSIIAGCAYNNGQNSANCPIISFHNSLGTGGASTCEVAVWYDAPNFVFRLYRGGNATTLLASSSVVALGGFWHHIEVKANVADAGGAVEVRLNGTTIINFSGDTRLSTGGTAGIDRVYFCTWSTSTSLNLLDDLYVLDTSGSVANNFLGDVRINTQAPNSDSAVQFTRSTGASNYLTVDEGKHNSDTDYVESSTVGHIDKYGYTDLSASVVTVHGLQVLTWARKTDAGARTMRNKLYSGATTTDGSAVTLSTSYAPIAQIATLNPDGSVQWTPTTVNAALAGFEIVT